MPELPEVITVTLDLKKEINGMTLHDINITSSYRKLQITNESINQKVTNVFNIGKQIIIEFENDSYISVHLGMTGQLLLNKTDKYEKAALYFSNNKKIYFSDIRKFGHLKNISQEALNKYKSSLGANILETFDEQKLIKRLQKRNIPIKNALLDQKLVSGAGNIYATDSLFLSKINPNKLASEIKEEQYKTLFKNLQLLLNEGIKHRGSSMNRYLDLYGEKGSHQEHFRVYKKRNQLCPECKSPLTFEKLNGRGSYYCPTCQQ